MMTAREALEQLFRSLVERAFVLSMRWDDRQVIEYLTRLLTEFVHMDNLYRLRDLNGRPLQEVAEMLYYADVRLGAQSFYQEREVHKHIGDYTLFWTGVYPEALPRLRASLRKDHLIDYVKQGKQSYYIVSLFDIGEWREEAPLYRKLSENFEVCMQGLHAVRRLWEQMAQESFRQFQRRLEW
ncbi:MAG: hypothetical protein N2045_02920 [Fimbriimonadales bacterium]|jgi:hypothetical protein|nr:hypothetical protein [Armatimonadota bacterium]MCX7686911.1 hypothetical protein [Fimbriimonadales bacterium]CUU11483.1 hypothetical protein GBSOP10_111722 [Armatimonadetes bacterium GBS]CUU34420.1 hypothetical protein DCOP10_10817 [Armatimonadetes bacterium DC]CUU35313.1 hypothetical protein GXSOP10_1207 [Armatimonadetes bacterium GXS]GBC90226.1 hypothetical protein HRbin14_00960 [bacterium HR14]